MKLVGSITESEFRVRLLLSNGSLKNQDSKLRQALLDEGHNTSNAYVLNQITEQFEDIYLVLIDGTFLVSVEIDKYDVTIAPIFARIEIKDYLQGLSKINQIYLAVAQDLASTGT